MRSKDFVTEGLFGDLSNIARDTFQQAKAAKGRSATTGLGGRLGALFSRDRMKYGRSVQDQVAANKFINKFVKQGLETLNLAVDQGLVNPESNELQTGTTTDNTNQDSTSTKSQVEPLNKNVEIVDLEPIQIKYNNVLYVIGDKGDWVKEKGNQPVQQSIAAFLNKQHEIAMAQAQEKIVPKTPAAQTPTISAPATNKASSATTNTPPKAAAPKNIAKPKTNKTKKPVQTKQPAQPATSNVTTQPRQTIAQKAQGYLQAQANRKAMGKSNQPVKENATYHKLNFLFESYMELLEASSVPQGGGRVKGAGLSQTPNAIRKRQARAAKKAAPSPAPAQTSAPAQQTTAAPAQTSAPAQQTTAAPAQTSAPAQQTTAAPAEPVKTDDRQSISLYFKNQFLDSFLAGIDMTPAKGKIDALLKNLPTLYKTGQINKELQNLANIAWTLAKK